MNHIMEMENIIQKVSITAMKWNDKRHIFMLLNLVEMKNRNAFYNWPTFIVSYKLLQMYDIAVPMQILIFLRFRFSNHSLILKFNFTSLLSKFAPSNHWLLSHVHTAWWIQLFGSVCNFSSFFSVHLFCKYGWSSSTPWWLNNFFLRRIHTHMLEYNDANQQGHHSSSNHFEGKCFIQDFRTFQYNKFWEISSNYPFELCILCLSWQKKKK